MNFAIRTLAALLALSSTAVAEDWTTLTTPGEGYGYEGELRLEGGTIGTRFTFDYLIEQFVSGGGQIPASANLARLVERVVGTTRQGLSVPNGALIQANCSAEPTTGDLISGPPTSSSVYGLETLVLSRASCAQGIYGGTYQIPISAFARSDTVSAMAANVAALEQRILALEAAPVLFEELDAKMQDARREADEGSAMAAAMTTVAPADGKANRIGFNTATYNGSTAVAVSYSRAAGDVDFNVGVAMAGENAMVKAGAGFSW